MIQATDRRLIIREQIIYSSPIAKQRIPWMVPKSDFFTSTTLNPEWSLLGYTAADRYSLSDRPGWLRLSPKGSKINTVIKMMESIIILDHLSRFRCKNSER